MSALTPDRDVCPACGAGPLRSFYRASGVPAHSVRLMHTREQARSAPRGDIELARCERCAFITNTAFEPALMDYGADYEETQSYSDTFSAFRDELARTMIDRYELRRRHIVEIGCGKGAFLSRLCELGDNTGTGFDPAASAGRLPENVRARVTVVPEYFGADQGPLEADCVVCQMTLEHIADVGRFLRDLRRSLDARPATPVLFQVPDAGRILDRAAFWDVYHEHCSYFTADSLTSAFERAGFEVQSCERIYHGQYLALAATPSRVNSTGGMRPAPPALAAQCERFAARADDAVAYWRGLLARVASRGEGAAVWGGGSKAVAFLHRVDPEAQVACAVDVNPYKQGRFLPGGGHPVVAPARLGGCAPRVVLAMNQAYHDEICAEMDRLGVAADVLSLN